MICQLPNRRSRTRRLKPRRRNQRRGMSTLELVIATGIGLPVFVFLAYAGIFACRVLFSVMGTMVGSPLL